MHICDNASIDAGQRVAAAARTAALLAAGFALVGCASPGPPLPPSLKLPEIVSASSLTATRVGDQVKLHWTTPTQTTDKLSIVGPITAEICRETVSTSAVAAQNPRRNAITPPCSPVMKLPVASGPSDTADPLPAALLAEPARLLVYRVQLLNSVGRTAGPSSAVFAASGPAPPAVQNWSGRASKIGAVLEWKAETGSKQAIELDRIVLESETTRPAKAAPTAANTVIKSGLLGAGKEAVESRFRAGGDTDAGGTIDRSALLGHTYRYTAQRVRTVEVGGQTLEVRSVPSAEVTVPMRDDFPPDTPAGLVAVPGFSGEAGEARTPVIDLSWEPNAEPRITGYRVYRRDTEGAGSNAWQRLDAELVPLASYRDATVAAGRKYAYRVTAVNQAGIESARSDEVVETAPAQ